MFILFYLMVLSSRFFLIEEKTEQFFSLKFKKNPQNTGTPYYNKEKLVIDTLS